MFKYNENDLDTHFIGQWDIHYVDDYGMIKAGTVSRSAVVRSLIDDSKGIIKLISIIPIKNGVSPIIIDGTTGFYGKISERAMGSKDELTRVDFLHIKILKASDISKYVVENGYKIWETTAEIDDIVFNGDNTYTYSFKYIGKGNILIGMIIDIPISHFNHYVHMRDLWYRDYKGATARF